MSEQSPIDEYIEKTEIIIKHLKEKKSGDRLELISLIEEAITAVNASTLGWSAWLQHPSIMKLFDEKELGEVTEDIKRMAIEFLEFDIKWTNVLKERKDKERTEKKKLKEEKIKGNGKSYIS